MIVDHYPHVELSSDLETSCELCRAVSTHEILWRSIAVQTIPHRAVRCKGSPDGIVAPLDLFESNLLEVASPFAREHE